MRLPLDTFIALQTALPGTLIEEGDSRPVLPAIINKVVSIPVPVVSTAVPTGTSRGSTYFSTSLTRLENLGALSQGLILLAAGLWRITGHLVINSAVETLGEEDTLSFEQEGIRNVFLMSIRAIETLAYNFDFNLLVRDDANIEINLDPTAAGQLIQVKVSLRCERIL